MNKIGLLVYGVLIMTSFQLCPMERDGANEQESSSSLSGDDDLENTLPLCSKCTDLFKAINQNCTVCVTRLLNNGANVDFCNSRNETPLNCAATLGRYEIAELLLERNANPNIQDCAGYTPLLLSCLFGRLELAKLLISKGADAHVTTKDGKNTILHVSTRNNSGDIISYLLDEIKADPSIQNLQKNTVLHQAIINKNSLQTIENIVIARVAFDTQNNLGNTALHEAARNDRADIVEYLLRKGANQNLENNENKKPCDYVTTLEIARLFRFYKK